MSGNVTPYVDFNTSSDSGENNAASIQPITNGEQMNATVLSRPDENVRKRLEVLRSLGVDSQFLQNADRQLVLSGPGKVTWPGSTTALASGIPTLNDVLWILPMLTPGFAQTQPVPPVASAFGALHLKRSSDNMNSILVTSARRSYAAGDQINVTVSAGGAFTCVLDVEDTGAYRRTIKTVATPTTTLGTVISALNGLTPPAPDNTQLVVAALEGGAINGDFILSPQARQFVAGNYDGEGHTITPGNLASFFSSNPGSALAEGDTLCVQFAMLNDTASTGGRRQAVPENTNTPVTAGMFFNSRVSPDKLVNALPICKVINGSLVFATGVEIPAGSSNVGLSTTDPGSRIIRNAGFEHGVTNDTTRYGISDWENRSDLAVNGAWRVGTTGPASGGKSLEFNKTAVGASTARLQQEKELQVTPTQAIRVVAKVRQLIAPTAGTYTIVLYWGDADSAASSSSSVALQVLSTTDASYRTIDQTVTVPSGKRFLKTVTVEVAGVTSGSTGVALLVDEVQVFVDTLGTLTPAVDDCRLEPVTSDAIVLEDPSTFALGALAALLRFSKASPTNEGTVFVERKDQVAVGLAPALSLAGRILSVGANMLDTAANARLPRVGVPFSQTHNITLLWQSLPAGGSLPGIRLYADNAGALSFTINASWDGTNWNKDVSGTAAQKVQLQAAFYRVYSKNAADNTAWSDAAWSKERMKIDFAADSNTGATTLATHLLVTTDELYDICTNSTRVRDFYSRYADIGGGSDDRHVLTLNKQNNAIMTGMLLVPISYTGDAATTIDAFGGLNRHGAYFFDEFDVNAVNTAKWAATGTGTTTFVGHSIVSTAGGTITNSRVLTATQFAVLAARRPRFRARVDVSGESDETDARVGWQSLYFRLDPATFTENWQIVCAGDPASPHDTGIPGTFTPTVQMMYLMVTGAKQVTWRICDAFSDRPNEWPGGLGFGQFSFTNNIPDPGSVFCSSTNNTGGGTHFIALDFVESYEQSRD